LYEYSVTLRLIPGAQTKVIRLLRKHVIPILKAQPGLVSIGLVPHPEGNLVTVLSEWQRRSDAIAAESSPGYYPALRKIEPFLEPKPAGVPTEQN